MGGERVLCGDAGLGGESRTGQDSRDFILLLCVAPDVKLMGCLPLGFSI